MARFNNTKPLLLEEVVDLSEVEPVDRNLRAEIVNVVQRAAKRVVNLARGLIVVKVRQVEKDVVTGLLEECEVLHHIELEGLGFMVGLSRFDRYDAGI